MKLIIFLFLFSYSAFAQDTRWIDIEWEQVEGAVNYEIELFEGQGSKYVPRGKYKVESASWSSAVPPGKYALRIRSLDKRGVPGEWSENIPVKVRMHNPKLLLPTPDSQVGSPQVDFEWSEVEGATMYQLVVKNSSGKIVNDTTVNDLRASLYLEELGKYSWSAYALEESEPKRTEEDFIATTFKTFTRVGGELEAPEVAVSMGQKITIRWDKIRGAKQYEVDYLAPNNQDKTRRFKISGTSFAFPGKKLRDGVTTVTVKAIAPGYPDSMKSVVQLLRDGKKVEVQDIIQGKKEEPMKVAPSSMKWKDELYVSMDLAKFTYGSTDVENDTELDQKELTAVGVSLEWMHKPKLNSLQRKTELSYLQMSSGRETGSKIRGNFSLLKEKILANGTFLYGGGVTYLRLPAYMGNRFENDIFVEHSSSVGPQLQIGYTAPIATYWAWQANVIYSQQLLFLDSARSGEKSYAWIDVNGRLLYYITKKEAIFLGLDYQKWDQKWSADESNLAGYTLSIGLKAGF